MRASDVIKELRSVGTPERAKALSWFFKTGKGQYGEGDVFFGITVPEQRKVALRFREMPLGEIEKLLNDKVHECRLTALLILVEQYRRGTDKERARIAAFYLAHAKRINNWDLVDLSAPRIVGEHLLGRNRKVLYRLARSKNLWERRIAILSTFTFIREGDFKDALAIAELLLKDEHDLIHKAVGWMLREIGKRSLAAEKSFLKKHAARMPRTTLRYAIERFPEHVRKEYLSITRKGA
jgi:3-methyladenine DNA glycosylase AlkD